ncbi:photosynthetic complex assembly protein PuhC [Methylocapsa palsarum]|uniref:Putative photosynthetic complex assembly protein n=1 Tax=Methylocapsa palsarum TaxID=1612308 RepID=A0A1I4BCG6_9HYPH|nr:photosynthetic complex assembly protein PuhC [Methylocapsa palsarum]SFK66485.1 putative photosynthetic complex assembly protein [Methylocapsa palsarum]
MSHQLVARSFPRTPLIGAALLVASSLCLVAFARLTDIGVMHTALERPAAARDLRFEDSPNGAVIVYDASTGLEIDRLEPGSGGFVRGILRSFARGRRAIQQSAGVQAPFRLSLSANGRLAIQDIMTRTIIELDAFGPTNAEAFARFLTAQESAK